MRPFCFEVWTGIWSWNFSLFIVYCFSLNFIYYASYEIISKWNVGPAAIASIIFLRELSQLSQVIDSSFSYYFQLIFPSSDYYCSWFFCLQAPSFLSFVSTVIRFLLFLWFLCFLSTSFFGGKSTLVFGWWR